MDTFEEMYKAWKDAETNTENWGLTGEHYQVVQALAAIAQAEQLKRIADVLESRKERAERFLKNPEDFLKDID